MKALDPKRHGAFVSAHAIASGLLADAASLGDDAQVEESCAVLAAFAGTPKSGRAAASLAQWAEGMRAARAGDAAKAESSLDAAARAFAANGWLAQATAAATELAALRWARKAESGTDDALGIAASIVTADSDAGVVREWIQAVGRRLAGAPPPALASFEKATAPFAGTASAGAAGGKGGAGGSPGGDVSELGKIFPKHGADKALAKATRTKDGFVVLTAYRKESSEPQPLGRGERPWDDGGGITLSLAGPSVALRMLDLQGTAGGPGERTRASRVRALYLLAVGETWAVAKSGVTVTP
jgi:hypothetical protein